MAQNAVYYHLRIHYGDLSLNDVISFIKDKSLVNIIVHETESSRPHIHCVILPNKTVSTFRQQMLVKFPSIKGNGVYSLEMVKDFDKMVRYCCKGEQDVMPDVKHSVYTEEQIEEFHDKYWEIILETQKASSNRSEVNSAGEKKKVKAQTWTEKVFNELLEYEDEVKIIREYHSLEYPNSFQEQVYYNAKLTLFTHMLGCYGNVLKQIDDFILQRQFRGFLNGILKRGEKEVFSKYAKQVFLRLNV